MTMAGLNDFMVLAETDRAAALEVAGQSAKRLVSKETTLTDIVQTLGPYISDEDAIVRGKAVSYLTAIIKELPETFLSRQQIQVLNEFFCSRIRDGGAITGLDRLQSLPAFTDEMAGAIAMAMFENHADLRRRSQSQRFQALRLLNALMADHRKALQDLGDESLLGIVDLVEGEKDPRNLMLVFSILRVVMMEWDIRNHSQLLFEAVYNYFPITFTPPPNDPYGITAQDLKSRLQGCLSSTTLFAPHIFPALIDRLDATSINTKKDALSALTACLSSYNPIVFPRYALRIWDALKFGILNAQEDFIAEESLGVLQLITEKLSFDQSALVRFLSPITDECRGQLQEPLHKQAKPGQQIMRSLSAASPAAYSAIAEAIMPPLFEVYWSADSVAKQRGILEAFVALIDSAIDVYGNCFDASKEPVATSALAQYHEKIMKIFVPGLVVPTSKDTLSLRITALQGLLRLSILREFLESHEITSFVQHMNEILLASPNSEPAALTENTVRVLSELSKYRPGFINDLTIPAFMSRLPDVDTGDAKYLSSLETLAQISVESEVFTTLVRRLLSRLDSVMQQQQSHNASAARYPQALLSTILYGMEHQKLENNANIDFYFEKIVVGLCRRAALVAVGRDSVVALTDPSLLVVLGRICSLIVRHAGEAKQTLVSKNVYTLFADAQEVQPVITAAETSESQRQTLILSTYLLAGLPKNFSVSHPGGLVRLINDLAHLAELGNKPPADIAISQNIALLANKFLPTQLLGETSEFLFSLIPHEPFAIPTPLLRIIFWLSKALLLRLAPSTAQIVTSLLRLLESPDEATSLRCAEGFALLLGTDDILSSANQANIRLLAKQRVFATVVPMIASSVRDINVTSAAEADAREVLPPQQQQQQHQQKQHTKLAYLTALSGILSHVPSSFIVAELRTLFPLLLQTLDLPGTTATPSSSSSNIKTSTLDTLAILIGDGCLGKISEAGYLDGLVHRLIKTVSCAQNPVQLRIRALRCLLLVPKVSSSSASTTTAAAQSSPLLPVRNHVLRALRDVLDDPKRDVRKAAVDARAAWLRDVEDDDADADE